MKRTLVAVTLLVAVFGLAPMAIAAESIFDSKNYLPGEAGLIAPIERGESTVTSVSVPIALFDGNYWHRFAVEKSTNLSGPAPDFNTDYLVGEGGLVNPVDKPMER